MSGVSRILAKAAGVILAAFFVNAAHAHTLTCPSGQSDKFTKTGTPTAFISCPAGTVFTSEAQFQSCFQTPAPQLCSPGATSGNSISWSVASTTTGVSGTTHYATRTWNRNTSPCGPNGTPGSSTSTSTVSFTHSCGVPPVEEPDPEDCPIDGTPLDPQRFMMGLVLNTSYNTKVCSESPPGQPPRQCMMKKIGQVTRFTSNGDAYLDMGQWVHTGEKCTPGASPVAEPLKPTEQEPNCVQWNSKKACAFNDQGNYCGEVNGDRVCVSSAPPAGECIQTASGAAYCTSSLSNGPDSPPAPNNGQDRNTPAKPDMIQERTGGASGGHYYYGPGTVNGSLPPEDGGGEGECDPQTEDCGEGEGLCDPDDERCLKINEDGVPEEAPEGFSELPDDLGKKQGELEDLASNSPLSGWFPTLFPPSANGCQTMTISFLFGQPRTFPPPTLCEFLETKFKPGAAWLLYFFTAWSIVVAVFASNGAK